MDIPYEKQFHFHDGTAAADLEQLKNKIESVSYQEFYRHVNAQKNDFAAWIRHVLKEEQLADELQKVTSIVETVEIINDFLHPRSVTQRADIQSQIEGEVLGHPPATTQTVPQEPPIQHPAQQPKTQEALDFHIIEEDLGIEPEAQPTPSAPAQPAPQIHHDADTARMIVKDFMYGLVFGLIIGVILGRIISF